MNPAIKPSTIGRLAFVPLALTLCIEADGFEFATHAALTRESLVRSTLYEGNTDPQHVSQLVYTLGLDSKRDYLGLFYFDIADDGSVLERMANPDEPAPELNRWIVRANRAFAYQPKLPSMIAWTMLGAIREDDIPLDQHEINNTPQDEPGGNFLRVAHHFFDPFHDSGLTVATGAKAVDWAVTGQPKSTYDFRTNHFSVRKSREAYWRALTYKLAPSLPYTSGPLMDLQFVPSNRVTDKESARLGYWATLFRGLGNVVHLVQDMAQPQHTRDDSHAGVLCTSGHCALGHKSYFEAYVEARVDGSGAFTVRERAYPRSVPIQTSEVVKLGTIQFGAYPVPRFARYEDYFSSVAHGNSHAGAGLANFSNANFYSVGTTPDRYPIRYPVPPTDVAQLTKTNLAMGQVLNAKEELIPDLALELYRGAIRDNLNPQYSMNGVPLLVRGAFDEYLQARSRSMYALTHYVYAEQARTLLPMAVAYSAGLVDYFFRGRLEAFLPDEGIYAVRDATTPICKDACGFDKVKLKVKNTTPNEAMGPGIMVAVVKFHRNACYQPDLSGEPGGANFLGDTCRVKEEEIVVSDAVAIGNLPADATIPMTFRFAAGNPIPINATDVSLQVVFRGKLGNEDDAVVVTTRNIAETNYVAVQNSTDYRRLSDSLFELTPTGAADTFTSVSIGFGTTTPQVPVATLAALPAPGYAQLAFLGDRGTTKMTIDLIPHKVSFGHPLTYAALPVSEIYLPGGGSGYDGTWPVRRTRGVYTRFVQSILYGAGTTSYVCRGEDPIATCTQSSLSPLTPAHARALQIAFN
jgi:hypothetical protein